MCKTKLIWEYIQVGMWHEERVVLSDKSLEKQVNFNALHHSKSG